MNASAFDVLSPELALSAVEEAFGVRPDGSFFAYPSYANRVYGFRCDDGTEYVAKFYRPGRWSIDAILEEHDFVLALAEADIPVIGPLGDLDGNTLPELAVSDDVSFPFALYPKRGGRIFDAESDDDWLRLGALAGRIHAVGAAFSGPTMHPASDAGIGAGRSFRYRERIDAGSAARYATALLAGRDNGTAETSSENELSASGFTGRASDGIAVSGSHARPGAGNAVPGSGPEFVPPAVAERVYATLTTAATMVDEALSGYDGPRLRLHGDFHRGNILDRGPEGLLAMDFDDAVTGPPVQDLWLLLPGPMEECRRELGFVLEGYATFMPVHHSWPGLVEPLRLLRMMHYLVWQARQRHDRGFVGSFPGWGSVDFWQRTIIDLTDQMERAGGSPVNQDW